MATKICPQCGKESADTVKFCNICGFHFPENVQPAQNIMQENPIEAAPVQPIMAAQSPAAPQQAAQSPAAPIQQAAPQQVSVPVSPFPTEAPVMPGNPIENTAPVMPGSPIENAAPTGMPMQGEYTAFAPLGSPTNPEEPKEKKKKAKKEKSSKQNSSGKKGGNGGLIAALIVIGVLIVGIIVVLLGLFLGWFGEDKKIQLSKKTVHIDEGEEYEITIKNYDELKSPDFTFTFDTEDVASVEDQKDGTLLVTGLEEGKTNVTISARRCEDVVVKITVDAYVPEPEFTSADVSGMAWTSAGVDYYFMEDGTFYALSESNEDYIRGDYAASDTTAELAGSNYGTDLTEYVTGNVSYVDVTCDNIEENWDGSSFSNGGFHLLIASNGDDTAIYSEDFATGDAATEISMQTADDLDDAYFVSQAATEPAESATTDIDIPSGTISDAYFDEPDYVKETWRITSYDGSYIFENNGDLYTISCDASDGDEAQLFYDFGDQEVTVFAVYGDYLVFGKGEGSATAELDCMDLTNNLEWKITDMDVRDFIIYDDRIFASDYSCINVFDFDGNETTAWEYSTIAFELDAYYIYVFDGNSWEVLDTDTYEDYGYLVTDIDDAYETDIVRSDDNHLFFTTYEDSAETVKLYAMDSNGDLTQIGYSHSGENYDTYNLVFQGQYAIYTINGGEDLVCTDVTTGQETKIDFDEADCYYCPELTMTDGRIICYVIDNSDEPTFLELDLDSMSLNELPGMRVGQ